MGTRSLNPQVVTEDNKEIAVYDNNNEQYTLQMLRELRKMNAHLEVMSDEELHDGDYDATN
jgi:hypothetical protein